MKYEIATAGRDDVISLVRLSSALFLEDAGVRDPLTEVVWPAKHGHEHYLGLIAREDALCLVARSGPRTLGYLAGYIAGPTAVRPVKVAELQSMYVEVGSRRTGVGSALVTAFLSWAGIQEARRVSVTVYASNLAAVRFYGRRGFLPKSETLERFP